jgi:hypothetical protein
MSPPNDTIKSILPADRPPELPPAEAYKPVEQFIWDDVTPEAASNEEETLRRIVVVSDETDETDDPSDSWRRQLISALHDSDRESAHVKSLPAEPPPIHPLETMRRAPRALVPNRPPRLAQPIRIERRPRHRTRWALLGASAAAGLLSIVVPRATNAPEMAANAASPQPLITGSLAAAVAEEDVFKPTMFNSPVLVREVLPPKPEGKTTVPPAIETVRTVPVPLESRPQAMTPVAPEVAVIEQPVASSSSDQPPPVTASVPHDRDALAALTSQPAIPPPQPPTVQPEPPEVEQPQAPAKSAARGKQISSSYERALPKKKQQAQARKQTPRANQKTASRSREAQWQPNRQGLSSSQPQQVEPSTMAKILKSLNPFASKDEPQKAPAPAKNIFR